MAKFVYVPETGTSEYVPNPDLDSSVTEWLRDLIVEGDDRAWTIREIRLAKVAFELGVKRAEEKK